MNEDKKYSIVGKVEIGTDEYRDLIESCKENEKQADEYRNKYWKEQTRANNAERERDSFKKDADAYWSFINSSEDIKTRYKLYLAELQLNALEETGGDK